MGMPITVAIVDPIALKKDIDSVFTYFQEIDNRFSTYKKDSEISRYNRGEIKEKDFSKNMRLVFQLSEKIKRETHGFFDIKKKDGTIDPSGLVKGWAISEASKKLVHKGFKNFFIEAGGDIQTHGKNEKGEDWIVGIENPFNRKEIIKVLSLRNKAVATSGTYIRGQHIYDPHHYGKDLNEIVSITIIGPTAYKADIYATAAFAMQKKGIEFLQSLRNIEGYMIDTKGIATYTTGFETYVRNN